MPLTILVVDDDPAIRVAISHYLEMSGYYVLMAENGKEAMEMVSEYQPHLIVTDIIMPLMDGYELVRQIRKKPAFRLLPVVFLSARNNTEERIKGYQLGCDLYLPKPFELEELGAVIRNLLERIQMLQSEFMFTFPENLRLEDRSVIDTGDKPISSPPEEGKPISHTPSDLSFPLTEREREVLDLLTVGLSNGQIGDCLHLSPRTVEKYVSSLLRKTATNNRAELVRFAMENHLVD
ncbi:MAG TPA: response regulator transcription factor [Halomicronema sp.]